jgi:hypothetical protein
LPCLQRDGRLLWKRLEHLRFTAIHNGTW